MFNKTKLEEKEKEKEKKSKKERKKERKKDSFNHTLHPFYENRKSKQEIMRCLHRKVFYFFPFPFFSEFLRRGLQMLFEAENVKSASGL